MRQAQADIEGHLGIHGGPQQHQRTRVQVHELHDEFGGATHGPGDVVAGAVHELREAVHDDVGTELDWRHDQWRERVVDHEHRTVPVSDVREPRDVGNSQRRVGHRFAIEDPGARRDRTLDRGEIRGVHERRRDSRLCGQIVVQEGERTAVDGAAGHHVVARAAELHDRRRDGGHPARSAVTRLCAFVSRDLATQHVDRRIEVTPVQVAAAHVRAKVTLEDLGHRRRVDHRERRTGLDRHVHAAVLAELVAEVGKGLDRVESAHGVLAEWSGAPDALVRSA